MTIDDVKVASTTALRSSAFDRFGAAAAVLDASGAVVETNEAWRLFAALNEATPGSTGPGVNYLEVCDRAAGGGDAMARSVAEGLRQILRGDRRAFELEYPCPSPFEDRWYLVQASAAPVLDGAGVVVFHVDISARKLVERAAGPESVIDPLTGLPDRRHAMRVIDDRLAFTMAPGDRLTVVHLGLAGLEYVDRDLGHPVRDDLMVQVTARVRRVLRNDDRLCRLAEHEFVGVFSGLDDAAAAGLLRRLRSVLALPFQAGTTAVSVGAALGMASSVRGSTAEQLVAAATAVETVERRADRPLLVGGTDETGATPHAAGRAERDAVVARSHELVMYFETDGTIVWASPATRTVFGADPAELVGRSGLEMVHVDDRDRVFTEFASINTPGAHVSVEFRITAHDGTQRWIEETATNLVDDPHVGYIVGNIQDITARKEAEDAVELQSKILDAAGQAIVLTDLGGSITFWNAAATAIYGWDIEEVLGHAAASILRPADGWDSDTKTAIARVEAGEEWSGDLRVRRKDGAEIPVLVTYTPVFSDSGLRIGAVGVSSDISERKQHELDHARLSTIVASSGDAILSTSLTGIVQSWNRAAEHLYGYPAERIIGRNVAITVPPGLAAESNANFDAVRSGRSVSGLDTVRRRADGTDVHVSISASPIRDTTGDVVGASAIVRDITKQTEMQARIETDRRRLADAQRIAHVGSFEIDTRTEAITWSPEFHAILGLAAEAPSSPQTLRQCVHPEDRLLFDTNLREALLGRRVEQTFRVVRPDGKLRWATVRTGARRGQSPDRVNGTLLDITDRKRLELDLLRQATHDALTGLPNRRLLLEQLHAALRVHQKGDGSVGVALIDVDRFKVINDSLGHERGDELLVAMAAFLRNVADDEDIVSRFGSDTFVLVMPAVSSSAALVDLVERIRAGLAEGLDAGGERYTPTVSTGLVIARPGDVAADVLRDADTAMYRAKQRGRNRSEWSDPALHHEMVANLAVERELRVAIEHDQLRMVFQPVLDLTTDQICACEALVRWDHPDRGPVSPDEFIPVAESSGLIVELGAWVLRATLATVAGWPDAMQVAVNISPRQLAESDLVGLVRNTLDEYRIAASRLVLEITETAVIDDPSAAARTISALRALGVRVVIDDFGTGYTSLSFLRDYPLDGLKIDRSFVADLDGGSTAIVDAIIRMSGALGLHVVAEGIETESQLSTLRGLGCRYVQGFLVSRPVQSCDLPFMRRRNRVQ